MADYADASSAANTALSSDQGLVEEYEYRNLRVKRGPVKDQVAAAVMLEGLAARRAGGGLFRLGKIEEPSE